MLLGVLWAAWPVGPLLGQLSCPSGSRQDGVAATDEIASKAQALEFPELPALVIAEVRDRTRWGYLLCVLDPLGSVFCACLQGVFGSV